MFNTSNEVFLSLSWYTNKSYYNIQHNLTDFIKVKYAWNYTAPDIHVELLSP